jgi:DNA-binding FrmR family transcriptional regulator
MVCQYLALKDLVRVEMTEEPISKETLLKRLKKAEGQIRGIQKMIESGRECEEVVTQLAAVRSAIDGIASLLLRNYMKICFKGETSAECVDVESLARAIAIWGRLPVGEQVTD